MQRCRLAAVPGTCPEAIKLALVIRELHRRSDEFETAVVHTGQHRTMLTSALQLFAIKLDFDLDVMRVNQTLGMLTARVRDSVENACLRFDPKIVLVQGDTTTAFASALAASYCKVAVGHIEAGLLSFDLFNPFSEEANRRLVSILTEIHFAPTAFSRDTLNNDALEQVTGKPVVEYSAPNGDRPEWVTLWIDAHGSVAYFFTSDSGMGPTQVYRNA